MLFPTRRNTIIALLNKKNATEIGPRNNAHLKSYHMNGAAGGNGRVVFGTRKIAIFLKRKQVLSRRQSSYFTGRAFRFGVPVSDIPGGKKAIFRPEHSLRQPPKVTEIQKSNP